MATPAVPTALRLTAALAGGAAVGLLGGLVGLGGAEFRLPLLLMFGFGALAAVVVNKTISVVVVTTALVLRSGTVPPAEVLAQWSVILNLLGGSLVGAWFAAGWAIRLPADWLQKVIALLLVMIALVLAVGHAPAAGSTGPALAGPALWLAGLAIGVFIGAVASLLGVAGGELLIPTFVLLFGIDIKLAGSLSLAVSLPTMLVGLARYSQHRSFAVLHDHRRFVAAMAVGSGLGAGLGGLALGSVPAGYLVPLLVVVLLVSAVKAWRHG